MEKRKKKSEEYVRVINLLMSFMSDEQLERAYILILIAGVHDGDIDPVRKIVTKPREGV